MMATPAGPTNPEITQHHVNFLRSRGYKVADVSAATKFIAGMNVKDRATFFADAAVWKEPVPGMRTVPDSEEEEITEEREGRPAKTFKVMRNLRHNEKDYKAGTMVSEEAFTPEQVNVLLGLKTIAESTPESEENAEEEKADTAALAGVRAIALLFTLDGKQMEDLRGHITDQLMGYAHAASSPLVSELWEPSKPYLVGQQFVDPNGNMQRVVVPGKSGLEEPVWGTDSNAKTSDGDVVWQLVVLKLHATKPVKK
jgi:hypothetical protein